MKTNMESAGNSFDATCLLMVIWNISSVPARTLRTLI